MNKALFFVLALMLVFVIFAIGCEGEDIEEESVTYEADIIEEDIDETETEVDAKDMLIEEDVIDAFDEAGLPIGETRVYTEENCPNNLLGRPGQYVGKADWEDTRVDQFGESLTGGTVEVFECEDTLKKRQDFLEPFIEEAMFTQYMFVHKNVIVRLDKDLTPTQAEEYKQVLISIQ